MSDERPVCPQCGTALRNEDSEGLCPKCLLRAGMSHALDGVPEGDDEATPSGTVLLKESPDRNKSALDADNLIGKVLGVYEITGVLGRGGMGVVYKARDHALDRWVALKVLAPQIRATVDFVERFLREAQAAARLTHPNVVPIYGIGEEEGYRFFVMEYVRGVNLAEYLKEQGTLSAWQALNLAARVTSALEAAHAEGIVHRDIKPQNIMIDEAGRVRVLDFGLAKVPDPETLIRTGVGFLGTPQYASPEQCDCLEIDRRSDLYSLGVVLYESLSGRPPHSADNPLALLKTIVESDPPPLGSVRGGIAPEIEDLVHRLLAKNPARRFQSAGELSQTLDRLMDDPLVASRESEDMALPRVFFAAELAGLDDKHVALFQECLARSSGEVLEASDEAPLQSMAAGRLVASFNDAMDAIHCAFEFQDRLRNLGPGEKQSARIAIHEREASRVSRDAALLPPHEESLGRPLDTVFEMLKLAGPDQILLTHRAFDSARRRPLRESGDSQIAWLAHGPYRFEELDESLEIFEVGLTGQSPLVAPPDSVTAKSATRAGDEITLGWRPAIGREIPLRPTWRLEESLGEGGFGEVWLARHKKSQDRRIFKFCFQADRLRALKREVMLLRLLKETLGDRRDISKLLDWNFDQAPFFIESEYTEGGSLPEWAEAQGGIENVPLQMRIDLVAQTATALAAAHSVGVIHKDIKPANVLVARDAEGRPQAVLADFGIGLITEGSLLKEKGITVMTELASGRTTSSATGTHLYMAPELHGGAPPSSQSDIYSLGVLFYQMVVGDLAQPLTTDWERRVRDPLLREDLHQCLAGDPADRFPSGADLARRLRQIHLRRRRMRAKRFLQAIAAVLVPLAIVGAGLFALQAYQYGRERGLIELAERERIRAEREEYFSNIGFAEQSIHELQYDRARELLTDCPGEYRHWEWGRLQYLCNLDVVTLQGHSEPVSSVVFSPDGRRILTGSMDGTAGIWDAQSGTQMIAIKNPLPTVAFTAKEMLGDVMRFDFNVPERRRNPIYCASFSPDGRKVATGSWTPRIWDAETGRELLTLDGPTRAPSFVIFSPDGKHLAGACGKSPERTAEIWDVETGRHLMTLKAQPGSGTSIAFSRDGKRLATACEEETAKVWKVETGRELMSLKGAAGPGQSVAFSPDGKHLAAGGTDHSVKIWDAETGRQIATLDSQAGIVWSVAFSPDGKRLATADGSQTPKVWDVETGQELLSLKGHADAVASLDFSPDGTQLVTGSWDNTAKVWDAAEGRETMTLAQHPTLRSFAFSPDGKRLATGSTDMSAKIWDAATGRHLVTLNGNTGTVWSVAFSLDGKRLATGSTDMSAKIWDAATGRHLVTLKVDGGWVYSVSFSPDGKRLATANGSSEPEIWDTETGRRLAVLRGHGVPVQCVAFSPDGERLATGGTRSAKLWDAETARELSTLAGHSNAIDCLVFSPSGNRLATASRDETANLWDLETGRELLTLKGHTDIVSSIAFSPDGKRLATGGRDGKVKIWDSQTGRILMTLKSPGGVPTSVAFSPDGTHLAARSNDAITLWNALPWRDDELPGDADMAYNERLRLRNIGQSEETSPR